MYHGGSQGADRCTIRFFCRLRSRHLAIASNFKRVTIGESGVRCDMKQPSLLNVLHLILRAGRG